MANRGDRGGAKTRARIAATATSLFLERGFDEVTIAEVAAAAGVSKVTVFVHFERKEDLLLDQLPDGVEIVRAAIRDRAADVSVVEALRRTVLRLGEQRHPLSVLNEGIEPFLGVILDAPTLIARLRGFAAEVESAICEELDRDPVFVGDAALVAALVVAAYRTVVLATVQRRRAGDALGDIVIAHKRRLNQAFDVVEHGVSNAEPAGL